MEISVIIPTYNDEQTIGKTLEALSRLQNILEIVVVDGGSADGTRKIVEKYKNVKNLKLINFGFANRGKQLHEGTKHATHEIFWFIHPDTRPVQGSGRQIKAYMRYKEVVGGNFATVFEGKSRWAKFLTWFYRQFHSSSLLYGDSAIFVRRETYEKVKGFRPLTIFEDVDLYRRIERRGRCVYITLPVTVLPGRFENRSFFFTFLKWTVLQILFWLGVPPRFLAKTLSAGSMLKRKK